MGERIFCKGISPDWKARRNQRSNRN